MSPDALEILPVTRKQKQNKKRRDFDGFLKLSLTSNRRRRRRSKRKRENLLAHRYRILKCHPPKCNVKQHGKIKFKFIQDEKRKSIQIYSNQASKSCPSVDHFFILCEENLGHWAIWIYIKNILPCISFHYRPFRIKIEQKELRGKKLRAK